MMNQILLGIVFLLLAQPLSSQELLHFFPEKPSPGEKIMLKYDLQRSPFKQISDFFLIVYFKEAQKLKAQEVPLMRQGNEFVAAINTSEQTKVVFVRVLPKDELEKEYNEDQTFYRQLYDKEKERPVQGANFALGYALYYEFSLLGMEENTEKGAALMSEEFSLYPESKLEPAYMGPYSSILLRQKGKSGRAELLNIAEIWSKEKKDEQKMTYAVMLYQQLEEEEEAKKLEKKVIRKYPAGLLVKRELMSDFWEARDIMEAKERTFAKMERIVDPADEKDRWNLSQMAANLAVSYGQSGNWEKFDKYAQVSPKGRELANSLNSIAWGMAGQDLQRPAPNLARAEHLSQQSLQLIRAELKDPLSGKPDYLSTRQWIQELNLLYSFFLDTHALIQYKLGNFELALQHQEMALQRDPDQALDSYERHALYLEKVKGGQAAENLLETYMLENKASDAMKSQYKRLFLANNTLESAFEKHLAVLDRKSREEEGQELSLKMLDLPASDFNLTNLQGKQVQLSDLIGKVVVIDFWASWCTPCINSFPAMKKLLEKYKDGEVVFLFINSWETATDKEQFVSGFLKNSGFDQFTVLLDKEDEVIESYKVTGVPSTFIIGREGKIKFMKMGYDGNEGRLINELERMIELVAQ